MVIHNVINRRDLLRTAAVSGTGLAAAGTTTQGKAPALAAANSQSTPVAETLQTIAAPEWIFLIYQYQDPYHGNAIQDPLPGTRWVAAEVGISNNSNQPLRASASDMRLRLSSGLEIRGGEVAGTEPRLNARILNAGELARGWVWFSVDEAVEVLQFVYVASEPEFRAAVNALQNS